MCGLLRIFALWWGLHQSASPRSRHGVHLPDASKGNSHAFKRRNEILASPFLAHSISQRKTEEFQFLTQGILFKLIVFKCWIQN